MALKFGTSGVRGLVTEMSDRECYRYAQAFIRHLRANSDAQAVAIGGDYRSSSPRIMSALVKALQDCAMTVDYCGFVPTPTLALHAMNEGMAAMMVTGSHIPDDRNGIKFYMPWGEILKEDEQQISRYHRELQAGGASGDDAQLFDGAGQLHESQRPQLGEANRAAQELYVARYTRLFPADFFSQYKVVLYQHSSVARDIMAEILRKLGADVVCVGRSDQFIPVDTEAVVNPEQLADWVKEHNADLLVSADGDGDRPLVVDEQGRLVRGDILGVLSAAYLGVDSVAAPVSCNTVLEKCGKFASTERTRIGSPFVIAAMMDALKAGRQAVVGYEANGGFLTASELTLPQGTSAPLSALPTRDVLLPIVALLALAKRQATPVSALLDALPQRYTHSGLLKNFPSAIGQRIVADATADSAAFSARHFAAMFGEMSVFDGTDGARFTFASGDIVHLRPSGNAPEFRCYTESATEQQAAKNSELALTLICDTLRPLYEQG
ncbi:MAG: phosphomannomutase [Gammaproteobacteria bacterium]|nr:phosphomannomutase [Gammaproteobacteria bacterium]